MVLKPTLFNVSTGKSTITDLARSVFPLDSAGFSLLGWAWGTRLHPAEQGPPGGRRPVQGSFPHQGTQNNTYVRF